MNNKLDKDEYIKNHIIWGLITFFWYKNLLFRCIPKCTYKESLVVFGIISICIMAIGIKISWKRNRNYKTLIENIAVSWGVYSCITYMHMYTGLIIRILLIMVVVSLILSMRVLCREIKRQDKRRKIIKRRIEKVASLCKRNAAFASVVIIVPVIISVLFHGSLLNSKVEVTKVYGEEHSLKANIDMISNIEPSRWEKLGIDERLDVCQKIINCEARYYGLSREIKVGVADLEETTLAYYNDNAHQVIIDVQHLEESYSYYVLQTLLHECCHAYQYEQVEVYKKLDEKDRNLRMYHKVKIYMEEFADYEDGEDDYGSYYTQLSEMDARYAGETESLDYIQAINEYLGIYQDVDMDEFYYLDEYLEYIMEE